jgi:hypothetical protein
MPTQVVLAHGETLRVSESLSELRSLVQTGKGHPVPLHQPIGGQEKEVHVNPDHIVYYEQEPEPDPSAMNVRAAAFGNGK